MVQKKATKTTRHSGPSLKNGLETGRVKFAGHYEVVGDHYHGMWEAKVDGVLKEGAWLKLEREPKNIHDNWAIKVLSFDGKHHIGYIKKEEAAKLAPFMDLGVKCAGRMFREVSSNPLRLIMRLYIKK